MYQFNLNTPTYHLELYYNPYANCTNYRRWFLYKSKNPIQTDISTPKISALVQITPKEQLNTVCSSQDAMSLMTASNLPFSYDRLKEAIINAPEIVGTAFVSIIVAKLLQDRTTELNNSIIIPTMIACMPQ